MANQLKKGEIIILLVYMEYKYFQMHKSHKDKFRNKIIHKYSNYYHSNIY